jgi:hypothetical protein
MLVNLELRVAKGVCGYFTTAQHIMTFATFDFRQLEMILIF